jgi:serine protease Do
VKLEEQPANMAALGGGGPTEGTLRGVQVQNLTPSVREQLGLPSTMHGVVISDLDPDSPAAQVGLQPGDVIQSIERQPVNSVADFNRLAAQAKGKVLLRVDRQGSSQWVVISPDGQ